MGTKQLWCRDFSLVKPKDSQVMEELDGFPTTAKWNALTAREEPVSELQMVGQLRAPTVPQGEESIPKFDFNEMFDQ